MRRVVQTGRPAGTTGFPWISIGARSAGVSSCDDDARRMLKLLRHKKEG
jgi:hypothetical protein